MTGSKEIDNNKTNKVIKKPSIIAVSILKAYEKDIRVRLNGLEPANEQGYIINVHEIKEGIVYKDSNLTVKAFELKHGNWDHNFAYRFETPDRTIVISGDCVPSEKMIENAKGCDVLIHEVYSQAGFEKRPPVWQKYHKNFHTSTIELGKLASKIQPDILVLYHILDWGASPEELIGEIQTYYKGKVIVGSDLDVY